MGCLGTRNQGLSHLSCLRGFFQTTQCLLLQVSFAGINSCIFCRNWDMKVAMALHRSVPGRCPALWEAAFAGKTQEPWKCSFLTSCLHNSHWYNHSSCSLLPHLRPGPKESSLGRLWHPPEREEQRTFQNAGVISNSYWSSVFLGQPTIFSHQPLLQSYHLFISVNPP